MSDLSVSTNLSDYTPGSTAYIATSGLDNGECVQLLVEIVSGAGDDGIYGTSDDVVDEYQTSLLDTQLMPWTVQDDGAGDGDGTDGVVLTSWYVDPDAAYTTLRLTARTAGADGIWGNADDEIAMTSFTDAPPGLGGLNQWANENLDWVTGNLGQANSAYIEGDFVPYYVSLDNLVAGDTYSVTIGWDTTKGGKHALDYLGTFDYSYLPLNPAEDYGLADWVFDDTYAIPVNTFMTSDPQWNPGSVQTPGVFTIWDGNLTAVSAYTNPVSYAGDTMTSITLTFIAGDTDVVIAWGGHIASRVDWGFGNSAAAISGVTAAKVALGSNGVTGGSAAIAVAICWATNGRISVSYRVTKDVL